MVVSAPDPYRPLYTSLIVDPRLRAPADESAFVQEFFRREQDLFGAYARRHGIPARDAYGFARPQGTMKKKETVRLARVSPLVTIAYAAWNRIEENPSIAVERFEALGLADELPEVAERALGLERARYERLGVLTRWALYAGDTLRGNPEMYRVSFEDDAQVPIEPTELGRFVSRDVLRSMQSPERVQLVPASFLEEHLEGDPAESKGSPFRVFG